MSMLSVPLADVSSLYIIEILCIQDLINFTTVVLLVVYWLTLFVFLNCTAARIDAYLNCRQRYLNCMLKSADFTYCKIEEYSVHSKLVASSLLTVAVW